MKFFTLNFFYNFVVISLDIIEHEFTIFTFTIP